MARPLMTLGLALAAVVTLAACPSTSDGYVYTQENTVETGSKEGAACTLDSECAAPLRCQGGICSTGGCQDDRDCREGELCVYSQCTPDSTFECTADQHPIIDINPAELDFGAVLVGGMEERTVTIRNLGSCLLTLQGVGFSSATPADFTCDSCSPADFPRRLPPNRSMEVTITYAPISPGERSGVLQARSDDTTYPVLSVPLVGRYEGEPRFSVTPDVLDFGFVAAGSSATRKVRISNLGQGNAQLRITDVRLGSAGLPGFAITPNISFPDHVVTLSPTTAMASDCLTTGGCVDVDVTFTPPLYNNYANEMVITYDPPAQGSQPYARVSLKGYSTTPPVMRLSTTVVDFGPHQVGSMVEDQFVTIFNDGQTPMTVQVTVSPLSSTDFTIVAPSNFEVPVQGGNFARVRVQYTPTQITAMGTPDVQAEIRVATNDPQIYNAAFGTGTQTVVARGRGTPNSFNDLLKVEMTFENGDNGFFGNDYRNVNLHLESPAGDDCTQPTYGMSAPGAPLTIANDPCIRWPMSDQPDFAGNPRWVAIGAGQEPERVILSNAGMAQGGYMVAASYEEDCASIPGALVAGLLGIAAEALVLYISSGAINLGSGDIASFIQNNCWDHASSTASVTVFINGTAAINCSKTLGAKGDTRNLAKVTRTNGQFSVVCQ